MNANPTPELPAATASDIRSIVGPLDDEVIAQIVGVGATSAEVLDAYTRYRSDQLQERRLDYELHGKAARVFDILQAEEGEDE
ncbi:hypothetical protein [Trinickia soli]|uniref:Uncharacterized protein n=1 Tax=Trinickia soli TaxID=380675 RepID=A0A2N7WEU7_9BURK|nr:hypothetical protein [Trinickia soli]KAA0086377.1 hypothetical protein CIW54_15345 [Paraburkholderia sp. T12-10]PMS27881.1 hypothetical protein C0Z19_03680 [Trinickia soli]CAB3657285.1 hypothetical protein LMG24076_01255 [Trinickia soli]